MESKVCVLKRLANYLKKIERSVICRPTHAHGIKMLQIKKYTEYYIIIMNPSQTLYNVPKNP